MAWVTREMEDTSQDSPEPSRVPRARCLARIVPCHRWFHSSPPGCVRLCPRPSRDRGRRCIYERRGRDWGRSAGRLVRPQVRLVHPSGIEGLIFGSWATLSGERLSCVGPAEGPGHGGVEISDELLDPGLQHLLAGEVAAADKLSYQNGKPDFDLIEP